MSALNTKINSYSLETGIEFNEAYSTTPTETGTSSIGPFVLTGRQPVFESTVGPLNGSGSWKFFSDVTNGCRFRATSGTGLTVFPDFDYTIGFWFKPNTTVPSGQTGIPILTAQPITPLGSPGFSFAHGLSSYQTMGIALGDGTYYYPNVNVPVGSWSYIALRRTISGTTVTSDFYINGAKVYTFTATKYYTTLTSFNIGQIYQGIDYSCNISNLHIAPASILTELAIAEIYAVGASINANITDIPSTASALITEPTLAFTFNDHSEVFTSITASSEMVNPFYIGASQNINIVADILDSTNAYFDNPQIDTTRSSSYPAEVMNSTNAELLNPTRFGPDNVTIIVSPMDATNAVLLGSVYIPPNYSNYIFAKNPLMYIRDFSGGNAVINNEGSLNFGIVDKGPTGTSTWTLSEQPSGSPLSLIGNGTSPTVGTPGVSTSQRLVWNDETKWGSTIANVTYNKAYTFDFWYKPTTNTSYVVWDLYVNKFQITTTSTTTKIYWNIDDGVSGTNSLEAEFTLTPNLLSPNNWHNIVVTSEASGANIQYKLYIDGNIITARTYDFTYTLANLVAKAAGGAASVIFTMPTAASGDAFDELAFYGQTLSASDILTKYNFVVTNNPNKIYTASPMTASSLMVDPVIFRASNINFPQISITGSSEFANPVVVAQTNNSILASAITASTEFVNPYFYGNPDVRISVSALTAYAETSQNNAALDGTYYAYVRSNINPYRYVTFDGADALIDYGSDNDYSVTPTSIGGTITAPLFGINNISAKTSGSSYTDGVILLESEYNDDWGTSTNHYHSSFWFEQSADDTSTDGVRVLWNLNGYYNNQHVVVYHYQNKLHAQFNNTIQFQSFTSTSDVDIFDFNRHHFVIEFDHSGVNHYVRIYVDNVLVLTCNIGSMTGQTINGTTPVGPNDPANNYPRMSVGCLITPFAVTALPQTPVAVKMYVDEVYWAKSAINQTGVTNLYNAMPTRMNNFWNADFMIGLSSSMVNPLIGVGITSSAEFATASAEMINSGTYLEFNNAITVDIMETSVDIVNPTYYADDITNINIHSDIMLASGLMLFEEITITIPGTTMEAYASMHQVGPYMDPYRLLVLSQQYKMYGDFTYDMPGLFNRRYKHVIGDID